MSAAARSEQSAPAAGTWPNILTWRAHDGLGMESVRVQLSGARLKANGRIVAAATDTHPAFNASYDLVTDGRGATKRLVVTVALPERERQLSIARDEENAWLVSDQHNKSQRGTFNGALDVDVALSPFFNALPIRRTSILREPRDLDVAVVYLRLPELTVEPVSIGYRGAEGGIAVRSPLAQTTVTVDDAGFILDYPGLAERI